MPVSLLRAYVAMLPRLEAEDSLRMMHAVAWGFGSMQPADARAYARSMRDLAAGTQGDKASALQPPSARDFAAMGIAVERR